MFDFPETVTSLDVVPTEYKNFYQTNAETGEIAILPAVKQLNDEKARLAKVVENERKITRTEKQKLEQWETIGLSAQEIKDLVAEKERIKTQKLAEEGNFEQIKKQMIEQHEAEKRALVADKDKMYETVKKNLVNAAATTEIAALNGVPQLLMSHIESRVTVVNEDGKFEVRVLDAKGEPRVNAKGEYTTIKDLVTELREDPVFSHGFKGLGHSGSGTPQLNNGNPQPTKVKAYKDMTPKDKSEYIKEHGLNGWTKFVTESK